MGKNEEHQEDLRYYCSVGLMMSAYKADTEVGRKFRAYIDHFLKNPGFDVERAMNREKVGQLGLEKLMSFSWVREYFLYLIEDGGISGINGISEVKIDCGC